MERSPKAARALLQPLIAPRGGFTTRRIGKKSTPKLRIMGAQMNGCVPEVVRSSDHGIKLNISQMLRGLQDPCCD